jgi:hypothetical protein
MKSKLKVYVCVRNYPIYSCGRRQVVQSPLPLESRIHSRSVARRNCRLSDWPGLSGEDIQQALKAAGCIL